MEVWIRLMLRNQTDRPQSDGKFPLAPMGVLPPSSAHPRPSAQPPIDTSGNFSAHVSEALASFL